MMTRLPVSVRIVLFTLAAGLLASLGVSAAGTLDIYFIDVEGGQATLLVTPTGQSMLIDAGWDGFDNRDPKRILAAARDAGIKRIDYLVITHFHRDHVGGVPALAQQIPIGTFVDYGEPIEAGDFAQAPFKAYVPIRAAGSSRRPAPGETLALQGVEVEIVTSGGAGISRALSGASGARNAACSASTIPEADEGENPRSLGVRVRFGKFTFLDLGDLPGAKLAALACPNNLLGHADVYLVPHHGNSDSAIPAVISAVSPRVAIVNNGATKGGYAAGFASLHEAKGIEDVWQLHRTRNAGAVNYPDAFTVNLEEGEKDTGAYLKLSADENGAFTVSNSRTKQTRSYK